LWGVKTVAVAADVGDARQVQDAVDRAVAEFGSLDILVNNAGGSGSIGADGGKVQLYGPLDEMSLVDLDTIVRVNFLGVVLTTRAALRHMIPAGKGRIINVSSEAGKMGQLHSTIYSSCKTAVIGFTRNLAHDIGPHGLSTVAVCPGIMLNEVAADYLRSASEVPQTFRRAFAKVSLGRASIPDEVAGVIAFLASDAASYIHGTAISVGGGLSDD
jgi:NAD(P)-dependent dehydrogenase (short-subunit alcohol dehydrogenase family)